MFCCPLVQERLNLILSWTKIRVILKQGAMKKLKFFFSFVLNLPPPPEYHLPIIRDLPLLIYICRGVGARGATGTSVLTWHFNI